MSSSATAALVLASVTAASARFEVPVTPDAPTAREWLQDELTNPIYHQGPSLLERFLMWLQETFAGTSALGLSGAWVAAVLVVVIVVISAVALYVSGPLRRTRRARHAPVLGLDDTRTADDLLAAAAQAASRGDYTAATLDAFRALARRSEERVILDPAPGRTAHEAAVTIGLRLPSLAPTLAGAASAFDAIYYGKRPADAASYEQMRTLEATAAATRPAPLPSAAMVRS